MQVRIEKRFSHGYMAGASYTYSKNMDATSFLNAADAAVNRSISSLDRPHRLNLQAIVELPFGRGRLFASNLPRALDYAVGGWQVNTVFTYQSGAPQSFGNIIFNGNLHDIPLLSDQRGVNRWFNTSAGFVTASSQQ